jgi:hypothetical protein
MPGTATDDVLVMMYRLAAIAVPPSATTSAKAATIMAGDGPRMPVPLP